MRDLTAFPSKTGFELVEKSMFLGQDNITETENCERDPYSTGSNSSDGIIEAISDEIKESEEIIKFSSKVIEESHYNLIHTPSLGNADSIVYSEIEINMGEDGSMKLFE
jgi:hypothetical protein